MAPEHSAEVLSSVPEHKKAVIYLMEEIHVLNKPHSGMSYSVWVHCWWINNRHWIVFKQKHVKQVCHRLVDENVMTRGLQEQNPIFPLEVSVFTKSAFMVTL